MAVERIDAQIASLISAAQLDTQKQVDKEDGADLARKAAEKKIAEKKERLKDSSVSRETFQHQNAVNQKMRQIIGGAAGREAADALNDWQGNQQLQSKLTEAQKNLFREAMANNPKKGTETANALNRLTQQPGFEKAIKSSQQLGTLQQAVIANPKAEKPATEMLQNRFMQAPKSDAQTKNQFLRFGLQQASKGQMDAVKKAGDMLGTLSKANVGRTAQRSAMNMAARKPTDGKAMANVDAFVQNPNVAKLPAFARTKATELLAKAGGPGEVKQSFEKLAGDSKFKTQTAQNKGRFFSTIGTGRPSEFRALADKSLLALQSAGFPARAGQVGKLLGKMAGQVQKGGADSVDVQQLIKASKSSPLPVAPKLVATAGLNDDEAARVRTQNRAKVLQFFNQIQRSYEQGEKKLNTAKYLEDVNALNNFRDAEAVDVSMLSPEEQAFIREREGGLRSKLDKLRGLQRQRSRELRTKRMPPAKRRAMQAARRVQGRQPKYFNPNSGRVSGTQLFAQQAAAGGGRAPGLPASPMRGQVAQAQAQARAAASPAMGASIQDQVAGAVAQLGNGPITADRVVQVAQTIARQVAQQVVAQVTEQLLGAGVAAAAGPAVPAPEGAPRAASAAKTDGWGIPRTFDRDLGGAQRAVVKSPVQQASLDDVGPSFEGVANEKYTGRMIIKDASAIRVLEEMFSQSWKQLTKAEVALLKNLGWNQQSWDTKDTPAARWPAAMATAFVSLTPVQRESVRKLGFTPHEWDKKVQAFTMGKNA